VDDSGLLGDRGRVRVDRPDVGRNGGVDRSRDVGVGGDGARDGSRRVDIGVDVDVDVEQVAGGEVPVAGRFAAGCGTAG